MKYLFLLPLLLVIIQVHCAMSINTLGGIFDIKVDKEVERYSGLIEETYNQRTNDDNYHKIIKIKKARKQIVAGAKYFIDYEIASTDCKKNDVLSGTKGAESCKTIQTTDCSANVMDLPFDKILRVFGMKCKDVKFGME